MDLSRYLGLFVSDAREHVAGLEGDAVRLESADTPEDRRALLDGIFRHLHSLKSSSATMGLEPIAKLSHLTEALVEPLRDHARTPTGEQIDVLLVVADELRRLVDLAAEGTPLPSNLLLIEKLTGLVEVLAPRAAPPPESAVLKPAAVSSPDAPVTIAVVRVSPTAAAAAARAFLALRRLEALGPVLATEPTVEALRAGKLPGHRLTVTLKGIHAEEALALAVRKIPDIVGISIADEVLHEEPAAPAAPLLALVKAEPPPPAAEQTVRVRAELLDQLLELAGELLLASARMREQARRIPEGARASMEEEADRLRRLVKDLNNRVLAARQTPVQLLAERLPRAVRDLSRRLAKPISLTLEGMDVTLDRGLVEALADPLHHALRNAADHGLESPQERATLGKPASGRITFAARRERDRVLLELHDDGRGFDAARLREKAVKANALTRSEADALTDETAMRLAFLPGVSTRDTSDDVSGRGVGMDAVLRAVEQLGGTVALSSIPGQGSTVRFVLPTTVSVVNLLLLSLGDEVFGLPMSRVLYAAEADLAALGGEGYVARSIVVGGERVPAYALSRLLGLPDQYLVGPRPFIVVEAEGLRVAMGVDRVLGQEEVVLRPLGPPLERIRGLAGTAILGSGRPIFVLDVPRLVA